MRRDEARQKAEEVVGRMTLEEAASQLRYDAPAIPRLGIPAYNWWNEGLHGVARAGTATSFPQAIGMAACFDPELTRAMGEIVAAEGRAKYNAASVHNDRDIYKGLTFWSPNVNIFRDPRWGRGQETYGEDPFLTSALGVSFVQGLQGNGEMLKAAACAKHYAAHSGPEALRHEFDAIASPKDMAETYLPAFKALVTEAKVEAVMGAYNRVNGEPACGSPVLIQEILRDEWGFEGHFVSDCWAIRDFHEHHKVTRTAQESAAMALKAGCDLNCGNTYLHLLIAHQEGLATEEEIRTSAVRLYTTRFLLGLFDGSEYDSIPLTVVESAEHVKMAGEASRRSCVLLKNDGVLPLSPQRLKTLAVIGPNANSHQALIGNYHGTSSRYITLLEGLQDALPEEVRVLYAQGCHLWRDREEKLALKDDRLKEAVAMAEHADAVVLAVGLDETLEGEEGDTGNADASGDKTNLLLPASQIRLMDAVMSVNKPTVICLMAGSAIDLQQAGERANAVLLTWYPGARGGKAVADILLGNTSPSGKLPLTFYHNHQLDRLPAFEDYSMRARTYRYLEEEPLYPFGYGLTYGDIRVAAAKAHPDGSGYVVSADIMNRSSRGTEDVVQVYCEHPGNPNAPPNPRLCAFERVSLKGGEKKTIRLRVDDQSLMVYDQEGRALPGDKPVFYVGMGQPDSRTAALTGHQSVRVST
ncbi:MAG: glycoside hydrolase family 3 C-terminal domain-containing protein [Eubacteriales bacterium]|nr:glycoside hydrolase family 3 C-terminal domain-containing protein [Eubacteriales bacterium]